MSPKPNIFKGKGAAFLDDQGNMYLIRCFKCGRENYAPAVVTGQCAWCGFDANKKYDPVAKGKVGG